MKSDETKMNPRTKYKFLTVFQALWNALLDLLFPPEAGCLCCGEALGEEAEDGLCADCVQALGELEAQQALRDETEPLPEGIDFVSCAYPYTGQARRLIIVMKYRHVRAAAVPLGRAMAMLPGDEADLLVPVPTTKRRLRQRGFNQAALLCGEIARQTGMPMADILVRRDDHAAQAGLGGRERRSNLTGCMQANRSVAGQRIVLVDDVYTTGATAMEAARALREAGAVYVGVFAAARSMFEKDRARRDALPFA